MTTERDSASEHPDNGEADGDEDVLARPDAVLILEDIKRKHDKLTEEHAEIRDLTKETRTAVGVVNTLCTEVLDHAKAQKLELELVRGQCMVLSERSGVVDRRLDQVERERDADRAAHLEAMGKLTAAVHELAAGVGTLTGEVAELKKRDEKERERRASLGEEALGRAALAVFGEEVTTVAAKKREQQVNEEKLAHEKRKAKVEAVKSIAIVVLTALAGYAIAAAKGWF